MNQTGPQAGNPDFIGLTADLCAHLTGIVAEGNRALFERIAEELPLELFSYPSRSEHNGWMTPDLWRVERALIKRDGKTVYDGAAHPLGVAAYSRPFSGRLPLAELKTRLFSNPDLPDSVMWHCAWLYRPWREEWGFCLPHRLLESLEDGEYEVDLQTVFTPGEMLIAHHHKRGRSDRTIVFHGNTCHPHMANDGFAGAAVMIRLFQWLQNIDTYYSYRLVLGPEHIGTVFYLRDHSPEELDRYVCGVFGEMMGTPGPFKVSATFNGDHEIDRIFRNIVGLRARNPEFTPFRRSVGNDETVWEAPGYEVPFVQVNRAHSGKPFPEYHSDRDTPELMNAGLLAEFYDVFRDVVSALEHNATAERLFDGLIALSNPRYDLYVNRIDPAVQDPNRNQETEKWGYFQDCVVRYLDGRTTILDMAEKHGLPFPDVKSYIDSFERKGLVRLAFHPISEKRPRHLRAGPGLGDGERLG